MSCECRLITPERVLFLTSSSPNVEGDDMEFAFAAAHDDYLRPLLGDACFDALCAAVAGTPTAEEQALLDKLEKCAAYAVAYEHCVYDPNNRIVPAGVGQTTFEGPFGFQKATDIARTRLADRLSQRRDSEADKVRAFLDANAADYPCWPTPPSTVCGCPPGAYIGVMGSATTYNREDEIR